MKNLSKQKLIKSIFKILKVSNEKKLFKLYRKNYDKWDSLAHLEIMFIVEKKSSDPAALNTEIVSL